MKMRTVELGVAYDNGTSRSEVFIQIPADTPEADVEECAREELLKLLATAHNIAPKPPEAPEVVGIWLYNSMEDEGFDDENND